MTSKACGLCLRDECERCHDPRCVCCGEVASEGMGWWSQLAAEDDDYEWSSPEGPVTL